MAILYQHRLDRIFHALGDATRREMIQKLSQTPSLSAGRLAESFNIAQPTASKHIKVLERSCLIRREIRGRTHYFSLNASTLSEAQVWLDRHQKYWNACLSRLDHLVENMIGEEVDDRSN